MHKIFITHVSKCGGTKGSEWHLPVNQEIEFDFNKKTILFEEMTLPLSTKSTGMGGSVVVYTSDTKTATKGDYDYFRFYTNVPALPEVN